MLIYIVYHNTYENTNFFYVNKENALKRMIEIAKDTETNILDWNIKKIEEGELFEADLNM